MWILPILLLGAFVVAAASKSPREISAPSRQLPPPGPISVLGEILRIGQVPPPKVILCAIAEAEAIGRDDLVSDIVRAFVAPVVYQRQLTNERPTRAPHERGSCAPSRAARAQREHERGSCAPLPPSPRVDATLSAASSPAAALPQRPASEEEILAMLHSDPQIFLAMVASRPPPPVVVAPIGPTPLTATDAPQAPAVAPPSAAPLVEPQPTGLPPEAVAQMQEAADFHDAADQTRALAPGSPLGGVSDAAWREFVMRLEREAPAFSSSRHVGQYRQRRERLAELGIRPDAIHGSAVAQRAALDADLADAHGHATAGGLISEHLGRAITLPGHDGPEVITLSGLLGVIQCAGLEGAVGWLERPGDRKRYPHTTRAFTRTNGVF
jgi:hypothetical protein